MCAFVSSEIKNLLGGIMKLVILATLFVSGFAFADETSLQKVIENVVPQIAKPDMDNIVKSLQKGCSLNDNNVFKTPADVMAVAHVDIGVATALQVEFKSHPCHHLFQESQEPKVKPEQKSGGQKSAG